MACKIGLPAGGIYYIVKLSVQIADFFYILFLLHKTPADLKSPLSLARSLRRLYS